MISSPLGAPFSTAGKIRQGPNLRWIADMPLPVGLGKLPGTWPQHADKPEGQTVSWTHACAVQHVGLARVASIHAQNMAHGALASLSHGMQSSRAVVVRFGADRLSSNHWPLLS